ncbi:MAG: hypothetical protein EDM77_10780 [Candidatus Jettenia sp. AMX1]|nr:MAG: hypothetical protein EDM77_10780 [Candidatus Jettenia sp. AMX1]MCE7881005.1 hypothetical protein [Candidatus Jettenia sp. AMX1]GIL19858.1 MAG: hypothetical protein BroJett041_09720 [Candidatus Jettenia caeni]GJQ46740.1 MAG: hypothetical protein JETCAE04_24940 [Candidatus Jettenia caeni]
MKTYGTYITEESVPGIPAPAGQRTTINAALRNLRISDLLTFIGINLRFITENIMNALIFFNILQPLDQNQRYDIHTPSIPDMCGETVMVIVFTIAYLFHTSARLKNTVTDIPMYLYDRGVTRHLEDGLQRSKRFFFTTITGFGLYFFSRYFFSPILEVIFIENTTITSFALNILNDIIKLCSPLIFVYVYCQYLAAHKAVALMLYIFFIIRNLFATNVLGFITEYDLHVGAPFLDVLSPMIVFYSLSYSIARIELVSDTCFSLDVDPVVVEYS